MTTDTMQERVKAWENFCEETPEFSDPKSREHQLLHEVYNDEFEKTVNAGKLPYQEALEQAREKATQRLGFEEISQARKERNTGPAPQFKGAIPEKDQRRRMVSW